MSLRLSERLPQAVPAALPILRTLVLARVAAEGGVTRAALVRDLNPLIAHRLSPAEWRAGGETALAALVIAGLVSECRGRFIATAAGTLAAGRAFGVEPWPQPGWEIVRDCLLPARALGARLTLAPAVVRALSGPDGLRALILQTAFGLPIKPSQSGTKLRADLAGIALERAFGNRVKSKIGSNTGLNAKAGRLLAGQLSRWPQDFGSDGRLIAALAAEQVGAAQIDLETVRLALLRGWLSRELDGARGPGAGAAPGAPAAGGSKVGPAAPATPSVPTALTPSRLPANDLGPLTGPPELFNARPDMAAFVAEVQRAARAHAEGWPGNRKAFISHVRGELRTLRPDWRHSEIEFKAMLLEAHRAGCIALASADLKDKKSIADFEQSAINYKNAVWHFVRVDD